jgi:hypothetical protein
MHACILIKDPCFISSVRFYASMYSFFIVRVNDATICRVRTYSLALVDCHLNHFAIKLGHHLNWQIVQLYRRTHPSKMKRVQPITSKTFALLTGP